MSKKIIYLTGGIATGKSTVAKIFEEFGAKVVDADKIVHKLLEEDRSIREKIVEVFGNGVIGNSGKIDRRKLGSIVFGDKNKLELLERIIHPKVMEEIAREISESTCELIVLEIPLIFEKKMDLHPVVVVYAPREIQIERLRKRDGLSDSEISARLSAQVDIEIKKKLADYVIDNSGSLEETRKQVRNLVEILTKDAAENK